MNRLYRAVDLMNGEEKSEALKDLLAILYMDGDGNCDSEKEWDADVFQGIAQVLEKHKLLAGLVIQPNRKVPRLWYDYNVQAWVEDGHIARCGHRQKTDGCYACHHVGEKADESHFRGEWE